MTPFGVFSHAGAHARRVGIRAGEQVLDVAPLADRMGMPWAGLLGGPTLNPLLAAGRATWTEVAARIGGWLDDPAVVRPYLLPADDVELHLPIAVADYVDFYSSEHHATNAGRILRPGSAPLTPNWKHLPVGYHGRAGTIVVSGTPIVRPCGQRGPGSFGPSQRLDFEAEVGFVVGTPSRLGHPVPLDAFADYVFGVCLINDWSARDLQQWETVPLGPFLGKSFATSMSPWIVPLDALEAARVDPPPRDPPPLPYLDDRGRRWGLDLRLEVRINGHLVSCPPFAAMYWTPAQQLAHLTVNGAALRTGDLYASGTVSGPAPDQRGSLLELSWNGADPLVLPDGSRRAFLEDRDEVSISAPGLGEVTGRIAPPA